MRRLRIRWVCLSAMLLLTACNEETVRRDEEAFVLSTTDLDFGTVVIGQPRTLAFTVHSSARGTRALVFEAERGPFRFESDMDELQPGGEAQLRATFVPREHGPAEERLEISLGGSTAAVKLHGFGIPGAIQAIPMLDFGAVELGRSATLGLPIENLVDARLSVDAQLDGPDAGSFSLPEGNALLPPLASGTLPIRFAPSIERRHGATLHLRPCAGCDVVDVSLRGSGARESVRLAPAVIDFGIVVPGTELRRTVSVESLGEIVPWVVGIRGAFPEGSPFALELPTVPAAVEDTLSFQVVYRPQQAGSFDARVLVETGLTVLELPVRGIASTAPLEIDPGAIDLGLVPVGLTRSVPIFLRAPAGSAPLELDRIVVQGASGFSLALDRALPTVVDSELRGPLSFQRSSEGESLARLVITGMEGRLQQEVPLRARAVASGTCDLVAEEARIRFGLVAAGTTAYRTLRVKNRAAGPCTAGELQLEPGPFSLVDPPGLASIDSAHPLELRVAYTPAHTDIELDRCSLVLRVASISRPQLVFELEGQGGVSDLRAEPAMIDFGSVALGSPTRRTVSVTNEGESVLLSAVRLDPAAAPVTLVGASPLGSFASGASVELTLDAAPEVAGAFTGTVELWPENALEPVRIPFRGEAR